MTDPTTIEAHSLPPLRQETQPACKVCGAATSFFGAKDFNRTCEEQRGLRLPLLGVPVRYHRCGQCGLVFTDAFDDWSDEDFAVHIYGDGYAQVDPDYAEFRPVNMAAFVARYFPEWREKRILDYGGGNGRFADELRRAGFTSVATYDRFSAGFDERPEGRFDMVTAFETLEHMPDPLGGAADIASLLAADGLIVTATLIQPAHIAQRGIEWWYIGPRNGHVTLHTRTSLAAMWATQGLQAVSYNDNVHLAGVNPPRVLGGVKALD